MRLGETHGVAMGMFRGGDGGGGSRDQGVKWGRFRCEDGGGSARCT